MGRYPQEVRFKKESKFQMSNKKNFYGFGRFFLINTVFQPIYEKNLSEKTFISNFVFQFDICK